MNKKSDKISTISSFLNDKDKLLTAFGIFLALTIFTKDVKITELVIEGTEIGGLLSFVFFTITFLIWIELAESITEGNKTWKLIAFENLISIGTMLLAVFWLLEYYEKGKGFVFFWIMGVAGYLLISAIGKLIKLENIQKFKIWDYKALRYLIIIIALLTYLIIIIAATIGIMYLLDIFIEIIK